MISLKNIKVYEGMSEETHCFEANLYVDNKLQNYALYCIAVPGKP